jgi:hypothetical protein
METDLFEVKINEQGRSVLRHIRNWAKFFYICTFFTLVFDFANGFVAFKKFYKLYTNYPSLVKLEFIASNGFLFIYSFLLVASAYCFYQFAAKSFIALEEQDESSYNDALRFLLKHITIASILFALNSLWALLIFYVQIKLSY